MLTNFVSVLDIGSGKINVMIGERGVNNTFVIYGTGEQEYDGYANGEFISPDNLHEAVKSAIEKAESHSGIKIKNLFVGVPAEFSYCECAEANTTFRGRTKITKTEINNLFNLASKNLDTPDSIIINRSAISFVLDDNRKCIHPIGTITTKLSGKISFVMADKHFIEFFDSILNTCGIEQVEYSSSVLDESLYLLDPEIRDTGAFLIDCGYISSFVAFVKGDGLIGFNAFSLGGGHISADLCQILQISFSQAENLKRKVVLSLDASDNDFYEVNIDNNITPVSAKLTNEIVEARLDVLSNLISKSINVQKGEKNSYVPVYLTGGGISYLKGAKDFVSKNIATNIEILSSSVPQLNRPHFSSVLGLLNMALTQKEQQKPTFKEKFLKLFSKTK